MSDEHNNRTDSGGNTFSTGFLAGILCTLLCVLAFFTGWILVQRCFPKKSEAVENPGAEILTDKVTLRKLKEIQGLIEDYYLEEVDSDLLSTYLFKGIAAGLDDPYANYYSREELQLVQESSHGGYYGIGAVISEDVDTLELRIAEIYDGSPAGRCGLQVGDVLLEVAGVSVEGKGLSETVDLVRSQEETFRMKIYRPDTKETLTLVLECGDVELQYVQHEMKTEQIGYIRLEEFTQLAASQFETALHSLNEQGMQKLIVDLRGNPGGLLDSVCDILGMLQDREVCVSTEDRAGNCEEYYTDGERLVDCEVAVLVDGDSASASELFAGAIQDWELGPVIGTQTYGKGVVQNTYILSDGSAVKFTAEKYYTPGKQDIQGNGITPDIIIDEAGDGTDPVMEKAVETLLAAG